MNDVIAEIKKKMMKLSQSCHGNRRKLSQHIKCNKYRSIRHMCQLFSFTFEFKYRITESEMTLLT